jgi:hypothetical protein
MKAGKIGVSLAVDINVTVPIAPTEWGISYGAA